MAHGMHVIQRGMVPWVGAVSDESEHFHSAHRQADVCLSFHDMAFRDMDLSVHDAVGTQVEHMGRRNREADTGKAHGRVALEVSMCMVSNAPGK